MSRRGRKRFIEERGGVCEHCGITEGLELVSWEHNDDYDVFCADCRVKLLPQPGRPTNNRARPDQYAWNRQRNDMWRNVLRPQWIQTQGGRCIDCGSQHNLQIDHRDRRTKTIPISNLATCSAVRREIELAKCVVRCSTCHYAKNARENAEN